MKFNRSLSVTVIGCTALFISLLLITGQKSCVRTVEASQPKDPSKLAIVWTSGDRDVALKMVFMYANNAKKNKWFDQVRLVVWGPSSLLLSVDKELQDYVKTMKDNGVELQACIACSNMYGVTEKLRELGIEVKGMGQPLTEMLKSDWNTLTF
ncbi:MAG: DsrE family protein [Candidatus Latescibacteria bacterium]|nr:DsrE family protein [Candidatus Latescibacterota bacterium]